VLVLGKLHNVVGQVAQLQVRETVGSEFFQQPTPVHLALQGRSVHLGAWMARGCTRLKYARRTAAGRSENAAAQRRADALDFKSFVYINYRTTQTNLPYAPKRLELLLPPQAVGGGVLLMLKMFMAGL